MDRSVLTARDAALGSALESVADDASAVLFDPAGLAFLELGEVGIHSLLGGLGGVEETALLGFPVPGFGGAAFAATYLDYGTMEGRDEGGSLTSNYGANSFLFQGGAGMALGKKISLGMEVRYIQQTLQGKGYSVFSPEAGILYEPLEGFRMGLDYLAGGVGSWGGGLVSTLRAGLSLRRKAGPSMEVLLALGNSLELGSTDYLKAGLEVSYRSCLFLRGGYQRAMDERGVGGPSLGGGIRFSWMVLDYAYLPYDELGESHHFSLVFPFRQENRQRDLSGGASEPSSSSEDRTPRAGLNAVKEQGSAIVGNGGSPLPVPSPVGAVPSMGTSLLEGSPETAAKKSLTVRFNIPPDFTAQGEEMEAQGDRGEALRLFKEALAQDPQNVLAWRDLGNLYNKMGAKDSAIQCYENVAKLRPLDKAFADWLIKFKETKP